MTCAHVLGLIDAGPFADYPRAHLDAAWQHARQCATCGPALEAAAALSTDLAASAAAGALAGAGGGRPRAHRADRSGTAPLVPPRPFRRQGLLPCTRDWSAWATALGGLAAGLVIVLSMASGDGARINIASPKVGGMTAGLVAIPSTTTRCARPRGRSRALRRRAVRAPQPPKSVINAPHVGGRSQVAKRLPCTGHSPEVVVGSPERLCRAPGELQIQRVAGPRKSHFLNH